MKCTRHNLFQPIIVNYLKLTGRFNRKILSKLSDIPETNPIVLRVVSSGELVTLSYKSKRYGLDDLSAETSKVFGNGRAELLKAENDGLLNYKYLDGFNTYILKVTDCEIFTKTYTLLGNVDKSGSDILNNICKDLKTNEWYIYSWYELLNELIGNIVHYTDIKDKDISIKELWEVLH